MGGEKSTGCLQKTENCVGLIKPRENNRTFFFFFFPENYCNI